jgi:hypothetical protein
MARKRLADPNGMLQLFNLKEGLLETVGEELAHLMEYAHLVYTVFWK